MHVSIHLGRKPLLKAEASLVDGETLLVESCGTVIKPEFPVACLLDAEDIWQVGQLGRLEMPVFCGGNHPCRLIAFWGGGGGILVERTDGSRGDIHAVAIASLIPGGLVRRIAMRENQPSSFHPDGV